MTTREQWLALAERCEKATGQDRDIDRCIGLMFTEDGLEFAVSRQHPEWGKPWTKLAKILPPYTSSLDVITGLIERKLPGWACNSGRTPDEFKLLNEPNFTASLMGNISQIQFGYDEPPEIDYDNHEGKAATEPLARCAAFCRAMAERSE